MSDFELKPDSVERKFTIDEMVYAKLFNETLLGKQKLESELETQQKARQIIEERGKLEVKSLELSLLQHKEAMRPYRLMGAYISCNPSEGNYICHMPSLFDEDDEDSKPPIVAYGDTPAQACANFDHIWMFGDSNV